MYKDYTYTHTGLCLCKIKFIGLFYWIIAQTKDRTKDEMNEKELKKAVKIA